MAQTQDALMLKRRARRRLVGAIALVLLVVIVLPVILDQEPKPVRHDLTVQIPSQDAGRFGARVLKAPAPARETPADATAGEKPEAKAPEAPKAAPRTAKPADKSAGSRKDDEAKRALALLNDAGYVVPIGVFANPDNARQARDKAAAAGFATYAEKIQSKEGEQTRVRAGPFGTRESAERARDKLKALGVPVGQVTSK
ncbi:MAG TPA: SPOR domain-containing protein [Burkholderiales bacterium]|nr:SPOR domain-containing protein [Burkholderiales bacterium]